MGSVARAMSLALLALGVLSSTSTQAATPTAPLLDQSLVVNLQGEEVGTMSALDVQKGDQVILERKTDLTLRRGTQNAVLKTLTRVTLGKNNAPLSYRFEKTDPGGVLVVDAVVDGKTLKMKSTQNGATVDNKVALPDGFTFSLALEHEVRSAPKDGTHIDRPVVLEELGAVTQMSTDVKKNAAGNFDVTSTFQGISTTEEIDAQGRTILARTPAVGIVAYPWGKAPKDIQAMLDGKKTADLLAVSTWKVKAMPQNPKRVVYRITTPDAATFAVPEDARQKVLARTATTIDIEVKAGPTSTTPLTPAQKERALSATPYEAIKDSRIVAAAKTAVGDATDLAEKVNRLNAFVYRHVKKKGLDRGYAPAIATLESKTGDCTEHSVLLSALLKSQGIPTKIVDGIIVGGENAGYHEWVEVNLGSGFIAVDPTWNAWPAGPERLKLAEGSTLPDEQLGLSLAAARLLKSGLKFEVLSAE